MWRESPARGRIAAQVLSPELQSKHLSDVDPPKSAPNDSHESRPERRGREKRVVPTS